MIIMTTNFGDIEIKLNLERAPVSSKNFKKYCEEASTTARFSTALSTVL